MGLRKEVIQALQQTSDWKESVRFFIDGDSLAAYSTDGQVITADANGALPDQDGVTPQIGDSAVLDFDAPHIDTGFYIITAVGDGSSPFVFTRRNDFNTDDKVTAGVRVVIEEGTLFGGKRIKLVTEDPITLNTTPIDFEREEAIVRSNAAPTVNDDSTQGYLTGWTWVNEAADTTYILVDATPGAAIWKQTDASASGETRVIDIFSASAAQTLFVLSATPISIAKVALRVNGAGYERSVDYTLSSNQITWTDAAFVLGAGDIVEIDYQV